jgi:hypothetical protein
MEGPLRDGLLKVVGHEGGGGEKVDKAENLHHHVQHEQREQLTIADTTQGHEVNNTPKHYLADRLA